MAYKDILTINDVEIYLNEHNQRVKIYEKVDNNLCNLITKEDIDLIELSQKGYKKVEDKEKFLSPDVTYTSGALYEIQEIFSHKLDQPFCNEISSIVTGYDEDGEPIEEYYFPGSFLHIYKNDCKYIILYDLDDFRYLDILKSNTINKAIIPISDYEKVDYEFKNNVYSLEELYNIIDELNNRKKLIK